MTPTTSASPATAPDAMIAIPGLRRTGPLRSGNPRGNPNLAPRCAAKARTTDCPCRAEPAPGHLTRGAMPNGRCRLHGGKSTGPRTPAGLASLARARTTHGCFAQSGPAAELRAEIHHARVVAGRVRLNGAAFDLLPWLPPAFAARLRADTATELQAPRHDAWFPTAPAAPTPKPTDHPPATATQQPPGHNLHLRRDARGRFAPPPPRPLRGRQVERAQARAEATALAPWKLAIAQARAAERAAARLAKPHAPVGPRPARDAGAAKPHAPIRRSTAPASITCANHPAPHLSPNARFANLRIYPMNPETALPSTTPAEAADASCAKTPIQRGTVAPPTSPAEAAAASCAKTTMRSLPPGTCPGGGTVAPPTAPAETADASCAKTSIQRGTVAPPTSPDAAAGEASAKTSIQRDAGDRTATSPAALTVPAASDLRNPAPPAAVQPHQPAYDPLGKGPIYRGTVTAGVNPFRSALLASTVSNTPDAHQLAANVERAGGWPVIIASNAATQAGKDWRPAATAARQRLADDAIRARTRCIPRLGPLADPVGTVRPAGATGHPPHGPR